MERRAEPFQSNSRPMAIRIAIHAMATTDNIFSLHVISTAPPTDSAMHTGLADTQNHSPGLFQAIALRVRSCQQV